MLENFEISILDAIFVFYLEIFQPEFQQSSTYYDYYDS